jgi:hypothetical protein
MKRFLLRVLSFVGVPIMVLLAVYLITDPFKTIRPFSIQYFDNTNRDYLSSELFLRNDPVYHYNSFIFGSSRCCGFNTYHWQHYLPKEARQYLFQAWSETLTGIEQKIDYIDNNGNEIRNVLLVFDIPGTFNKEQQPKQVLSIKHYKFSGQSKMAYQANLFYGFVQKPSKWFSSVKERIRPVHRTFPADTITNDWERSNRFADVSFQPQKDSLRHCSDKSKDVFLKEISNKTDSDLVESKPLITEEFNRQLVHIKDVFVKHGTDYRIIISPAYCYTHPKINKNDLIILQDIFGKQKVFDYSGKNDITTDCYNFSDPNHFGLSVGWQIIEDIYNNN